MSDLFHRLVPADFIDAVVGVMQDANHHTYQVLTKRPKRARDLLESRAVRRLPDFLIWVPKSYQRVTREDLERLKAETAREQARATAA